MDGFLIIITIFIIICCMPLFCNTESFTTLLGNYKNYCSSCGSRSRYMCSKCTNCGLGIRADGTTECVPGDSYGPYYRNDFKFYEYGEPLYYPPYSYINPTVHVKSNYPYNGIYEKHYKNLRCNK